MSHADQRRRSAITFVICLLIACSSPEERFAKHVERAEELAEAGETEEAILEYRNALKIDSESAAANERLGSLLLRQGDLSATYYLGEAFRIDPSRIDLAMRLARVLLASGQMDEAETVIETAVQRHPDAAAIHSTQAELFLYRNDPERALAAAVKATELDPDDVGAWMQLGRVHEGRLRMAELKKERPQKGIRQAGISAFARADELAGGLVQARVERARLLGLRKTARAEAMDAFVDAVELAEEQDDDDQRFFAAEAMEGFAITTNRPGMRIWAIREMLEADDSRLDLWEKLARLVDGANRLGVVIYHQLLEKRPDDVRAHLMFVSYLMGRGHESEAMKHLREVIDRDLGSPLPWEQLIRIQINRGRIANSRANFVRMSDEFPDDPVTKRTEARIAVAEGRLDDAGEILDELEMNSESFEVQRLRALVMYRKGNLTEAAAAINRALELRGDFSPEAARLKARIHHDKEEWAGALATLTNLANRGHSVGDAGMIMRARALYGLDRPEKGREVLEEVLAGKEPPATAAIEYARREGDAQPNRAVFHLAAALAREPVNPELLEAIVELDLGAGRLTAALHRINAAIDSGRAKPETLLLRAHILTKAGALDRAEADALRAFEADPSLPGGVDLLYAIYEAQGRLDEARASFEEAEAAGVLHSGARLFLGRIYLRQGETAKAQKMLEKVLRDDPNTTGAKNDLAYLLAESERDLDRALRLAEEAQQSMRTDPNAADTVGYVYLRKGLHEAALQQFLYALELNAERPSRVAPMLHYHLGLTLDALDRNDEAVDAFEKALALDSNFPEAEDARRRLEEAHRPDSGAPRPS
jgi:tetratricopeptide (TPR) repeat protein